MEEKTRHYNFQGQWWRCRAKQYYHVYPRKTQSVLPSLHNTTHIQAMLHISYAALASVVQF